MTLTREYVINSIHNHLDVHKNRSAEVVESMLEIMKKTLENGEDVLISGFGKFCVRDKRKRRGRDPQPVNRIPDVINSEPGFITIENLPMVKFRTFPLRYYVTK